jgi:hypothetical protein
MRASGLQSMSETIHNAWQCPSCARLVPRTVEVCRCGSERRRLEALGFKLDRVPDTPVARPAPSPLPVPVSAGPAGWLFGYRSDATAAPVWRVMARAVIALTASGVLFVAARWASSDPAPTRATIQVLTTLDAFVRNRPDVDNAIPAFLASAGQVGRLTPAGLADEPVTAIDEAELRQGFCSPSTAALVRYEYPGYYDRWSDDTLERAVLEKRPEYANRRCMLSSRLDASPDEIIKYDLIPRTLVTQGARWVGALLATFAATLLLLNVYYRGVVPTLPARAD